MGSSTSSSELRRARTARAASCLALAAASFAVSVAIASIATASGWLSGKWAIETRLPDRDDGFFIYAGDDDLEHRVLWHGFGRSIESARAADVVIIGDSRSQLGLREAGLEAFQAASGRRVFHLGLGYAEQALFPLALIERHDLRPRVAVVALSSEFFRRQLSSWAWTVVSEDRWTAWKGTWEKTAQWHVARWVHRLVPRIDIRENELWGPFVLYRSDRTGSWIPVVEPTRSAAIRVDPARQQRFDEQLGAAAAFEAALDARGTQLVLTVIPNDLANYAHAELVADRLDLPLIAPRLDGLAATDSLHLDLPSATRFGDAFWTAFGDDPVVARALER